MTLTATVVAAFPGSGTPTGTVTFMDGANLLGTGTLNGSDQATFTTSALSAGMHLITAVYGGDLNFTTSTSLPIPQLVLPPITIGLFTSSPDSVSADTPVTPTAPVNPSSPSGVAPTAAVTTNSGSTIQCTDPPYTSGQPAVTVESTAGTPQVTVNNSDDSSFDTVTSEIPTPTLT